jgi:hypothetical protein
VLENLEPIDIDKDRSLGRHSRAGGNPALLLNMQLGFVPLRGAI